MAQTLRQHLMIIGALILSAAATSCHAESGTGADRLKVSKDSETIGVATQEADGTILLQLRTPSESGMIGDALIRYKPGDPHYDEISHHVGPIPKGGSVFVKPFPDTAKGK